MRRKVLILIIMTIPLSSITKAQKILTLKECYNLAMSVNALSGEKASYSDISKLKENNLTKGWLPTLDANGSFVYNSSVVDIGSALGSLPIPGIANAIKPLPHEQYKITLDINQVIYDGGVTKRARAVEKADLSVSAKQTDSDMYKIREQINNCYFNLLLLARQKELLENYLALINKRISSMQSAVVNGFVIKSDIDVLMSEKIKIEQQIAGNDIKTISLLKILSSLTGTEIDTSTVFLLPPESPQLTSELSRPELLMFDLKREQLTAGMKMIESKRMPKAFGFATLGYGNPPGSNFFKNEFAPYYILGAAIKWNIFDWNKVKNEKQIVTLQQSIIEDRKKDLTDNLIRLLESKASEISSLKVLMETDSELITLRKRISDTAESQYENGIITATDYLNELNSEQQALINHEIHKINLVLAGIEYLNISGKEIE